MIRIQHKNGKTITSSKKRKKKKDTSNIHVYRLPLEKQKAILQLSKTDTVTTVSLIQPHSHQTRNVNEKMTGKQKRKKKDHETKQKTNLQDKLNISDTILVVKTSLACPQNEEKREMQHFLNKMPPFFLRRCLSAAI